jgi:methylglyoxal synthase
MPSTKRRLRIGLISNRLHQESAQSALVQLLRLSRHAIAKLDAEWIVVGRTLDTIISHGLLDVLPSVERFPFGRDGGLMKLVARVVEQDPLRAVDAVIYLIDPVDPSSIFPEALALKRQCVVQRKPFLASFAAAREWLEIEAFGIGASADVTLNPTFDLANEGIALIAHDAMKPKMLALAEKHFPLLDQFGYRCGTGTTGGLLNQLAQKIKGGQAGREWVQPFLSGPLGGDAQIAELVLDRKLRRIIFLEDPHVARQHEADIQLLERAARTVGDFSLVVSDIDGTDRWLDLLSKRVAAQSA